MNAWSYLIAGIVFEVIGTTCLKLSDGFSDYLYSTLCIIFFIAALYMLSQSVKSIEIGVVYAIWCGVGIALITLIGILFFQETMSLSKVLFIVLIITGVAGLQMTTEARSNSLQADASKGAGN